MKTHTKLTFAKTLVIGFLVVAAFPAFAQTTVYPVSSGFAPGYCPPGAMCANPTPPSTLTQAQYVAILQQIISLLQQELLIVLSHQHSTASTPVLNSISPTVTAIGSTVTLSGYGFTTDNTVLFNGNTAAHVQIPMPSGGVGSYSPTSLTFTVPSSLTANCPTGSMCPMFAMVLTNGQYQVTVENSNGTSNAVTLTVGPSVSNPQNTSLTATPINGSSPLTVSFVGTGLIGGNQYIIDYADGANSGPLSPINVCMGTLNNPQGCPKISATHTYATRGTYNAVLEPYMACMWSNPRCMVATQSLGNATITVTQ